MTPRVVIVTVAVGLAAGMLVGLAGVIALAVLERPVPDVLANVTIGLVGAMAGLLARTGTDDPRDNPPAPAQRVEVVNTPADPVPTTESTGPESA